MSVLISCHDDGSNYVRIIKDPKYQDYNKLMYIVDYNDCINYVF